MLDIWYIFPLVRQLVGRLSIIGAILLIAACFVQVALFAILFSGFPGEVWWVGCLASVGRLVGSLALFLVCLLGIWTHEVLLAHRGTSVSRFVGWFTGFLGAVMCVCSVFTSLSGGQALLARQDELPMWIYALLLSNILFNLPNMAAAPVVWRLLLVVYPLLGLAGYLASTINVGAWVSIAGVLMLNLSLIVGGALLLRLSRFAPLVVSMPER